MVARDRVAAEKGWGPCCDRLPMSKERSSPEALPKLTIHPGQWIGRRGTHPNPAPQEAKPSEEMGRLRRSDSAHQKLVTCHQLSEAPRRRGHAAAGRPSDELIRHRAADRAGGLAAVGGQRHGVMTSRPGIARRPGGRAGTRLIFDVGCST
jgi:hypothetical protein